jgi:hypothetical protein
MKAASGPQGMSCGPGAGSARARGSSGELEFADAAVRERELVSQRGDLFTPPLVVVERRSEPDADRFVFRAPAHREPRQRPLVAALPLDLGAQAGVAVEELAADPRAGGDERGRDRFAFALELDPAAAGAPRHRSSGRLRPCSGRPRALGSRAFFSVALLGCPGELDHVERCRRRVAFVLVGVDLVEALEDADE